MHQALEEFLSGRVPLEKPQPVRDKMTERWETDGMMSDAADIPFIQIFDSRFGVVVPDEGMITTERAYIYGRMDAERLPSVLNAMGDGVLFYYVLGEDLPTSRNGDAFVNGYTNMLRKTEPVSRRTTKIGHVLNTPHAFSCRYEDGSENEWVIPLDWATLENGKSLVPLENGAHFRMTGNDARFFHRDHIVTAGQCLIFFTPQYSTGWDEFLQETGLFAVNVTGGHPPRSPSPVGMTLGLSPTLMDFENWLASIQTGGQKDIKRSKKQKSRTRTRVRKRGRK